MATGQTINLGKVTPNILARSPLSVLNTEAGLMLDATDLVDRIASIEQSLSITIEVVDQLPQYPSADKVYFVRRDNPDSYIDKYAKYIYVDGEWEPISVDEFNYKMYRSLYNEISGDLIVFHASDIKSIQVLDDTYYNTTAYLTMIGATTGRVEVEIDDNGMVINPDITKSFLGEEQFNAVYLEPTESDIYTDNPLIIPNVIPIKVAYPYALEKYNDGDTIVDYQFLVSKGLERVTDAIPANELVPGNTYLAKHSFLTDFPEFSSVPQSDIDMGLVDADGYYYKPEKYTSNNVGNTFYRFYWVKKAITA